ncbi:hypothetical protein BGZ46_006498 [Entomortierella lignicola]|nr:hypothetical protein BGZ46_006498 [Entomortierella lignicola]
MSQNVIQLDEIKTDTLVSSKSLLPTPCVSTDSHHDNTSSKINSAHGKITSKLSTSYNNIAPEAVITPSTPKKHKIIHPAIQTTSFYNQNISSTAAKTLISSSTPSSTSASSSGFSTKSAMDHIRRWISGFSSSKKQQQECPSNPKPNSKVSAKGRTIGPISAPQPLTTPAPYACTPLPYFDSLSSPASFKDPFPMEASVPRSLAKPTTSCPDLPIGKSFDFSAHTTHSTLRKKCRTSWKGRLFSLRGKRQERRVSTNSNENDDYDWSGQENEHHTGDSYKNTTIESRTTSKPNFRISAPLVPPILATNQKTVSIIPSGLMSPTDNLFGSDAFDPFKIASNNRCDEREILSDVSRSTLEKIPVARDTPESVETLEKLDQEEPGSQYSLNLMSLEKVDEDSDLTKLQGVSEINEDNFSENKDEVVMNFATSVCERLGSDFVVSPSYFNQNKLEFDPDLPFSRSEEEDRLRPRPNMRSGLNTQRRALDASSSYSTSSELSVESNSSDSSDSSGSSPSSPTGGLFFFSTQFNATSDPSKASTLIKPPSEVDNPLKELKLPKVSTYSTNPKAFALKRLAYIHTLKKLRERERRPFRHAVLLHLTLLQLRQGITEKQCDEISDFYTSMWSAQFPVRWNMTKPILLTQRQQSLQNLDQPTQLRSQQNQFQESLKSVAIESAKELKPRRSFAASIQSCIRSTKALSGSNETNNAANQPILDESILNSPQSTENSLHQSAIGAAQTQNSAVKVRAPLLRMPPYPLISQEKKATTIYTNIPAPAPLRRTPGMSFTSIGINSPNSSDSSDSEDGDSEDEDINIDENMKDLSYFQQYEVVQPLTPSVDTPKRTTGQKAQPSIISLLSSPPSSIQFPVPYLLSSPRVSQFHNYLPIDRSRIPVSAPSAMIASSSVLTTTLPCTPPYSQHVHQALGHVENYGKHAHKTRGGLQPILESPPKHLLQLAGNAEKHSRVKVQPSLPSPPPPPTVDSQTVVATSYATYLAKLTTIRANSSPLSRDCQVNSGPTRSCPSGNQVWATRLSQEIKPQQSLDDALSTSREQNKQNKNKDGVVEEEEEDVPLALIQKRLSTDMLRLAA